HVPRVRRNVGALDHVAHVAEVALVHDVPELLLCHTLHLPRSGLVHVIEELGEGVAQAHAAPAPMADVEDALHLRDDLGLVEVIRALPLDRMSSGGLEAAFLAQSVSASSAFWKRLAWERSAFASVSNQ